METSKIYKQFDDLLDSYNNTNSFLYSSLNMEIVCSILKGINVIVRDLANGNRTQEALSERDFDDFRVIRLTNIQVLKREYFENIEAKELKKMQQSRNQGERSFRKEILETDTDEQKLRKIHSISSASEIEENLRASSMSSSKIEEDFVHKKIQHEDVEIDIEVYSYAPRVFRFIRAIDNVSEFDIMKSVKPQLNKMQIFKTNQN